MPSDTEDRTETLLLLRALGRARAEDYVNWAVDELCRDIDVPSLRILAGLSTRFDRDEVERYFLQTCSELGLAHPRACPPPLETARLIRSAYDRGDVLPAEALEMMAEVYRSSGHTEEALAPWDSMLEELIWGEGYLYPSTALISEEQAVHREWLLFDRALRLALPRGWLCFHRCTACGHFGDAYVKEPSRAAVIIGKLRGRPAWAKVVCARCGSSALSSLIDPESRSAYLEHMERRAT